MRNYRRIVKRLSLVALCILALTKLHGAYQTFRKEEITLKDGWIHHIPDNNLPNVEHGSGSQHLSGRKLYNMKPAADVEISLSYEFLETNGVETQIKNTANIERVKNENIEGISLEISIFENNEEDSRLFKNKMVEAEMDKKLTSPLSSKFTSMERNIPQMKKIEETEAEPAANLILKTKTSSSQNMKPNRISLWRILSESKAKLAKESDKTVTKTEKNSSLDKNSATDTIIVDSIANLIKVTDNDTVIEKISHSVNHTVKRILPNKYIVSSKSRGGLPLVKNPPNRLMPPKKSRKDASHKVSHDIDQYEISSNKTERERIRNEIYRINKYQLMRNVETFGPFRQDDIVIVIQVHNRLDNLKLLVASLSKASNISSAVVIFSHDYFSPSINDFVRSINSFRTLQIFFPLSVQLFPHTFPGRDSRDCKWDTVISNRTTDDLVCLNQKWPDQFGHFREASFTQIKHHWWWKLNRIFNNLDITRNFSGDVLFVEEDHFVSEDVFHMMRLMQKARPFKCPNCSVLSLGNYNVKHSLRVENMATKDIWLVNKHNMGFTLNKVAFNIISKCSNQFCDFDDYNWDWSLLHLVGGCAKNQLQMMALKIPRVHHLGVCGTHKKQSQCNLKTEMKKITNSLKLIKMFPKHLEVLPVKSTLKKPKGNGGWGDLRDRTLCKVIGNKTFVT